MKYLRTFLILTLLILMGCATLQPVEAVTITFQNCYPYYWVGAVKWNDDHTEYSDVPEFELQKVGIKEVELEPGDYAITVFRPPLEVEHEGRFVTIPPKIIDFEEVTITKPVHLSYGCEGGGNI
jgi:hypothetical protein